MWFTVVAYDWPTSHLDRVRKPQPLTMIAGRALIARMVTANTSAASGSTTATRAAPCQSAPSLNLRPAVIRRALRARRITRAIIGKGPDLSACRLWSLLDRLDLLQRLGHNLGRQLLEVDLSQVRRRVPVLRVDRPLEDRADVFRRGRTRLVRVHDRVLIVDDRVAVGDLAKDQRDRPVGGCLLHEGGRFGGDGPRRRQHGLALAVHQGGVTEAC